MIDSNAPVKRMILVVEDDAIVRMTVAAMLEDLGYAVVEAGDGEQASALLHDGLVPDLVFTDVMMPGRVSAHDLAAQLARDQPATKLLFTSGYGDLGLHGAHSADVLAKPYRPRQLAERIRAMLDD